MGSASSLCPGTSDVDLFRNRDGVVHLDPEIPDGALDAGVAEQQLDRPQVARAFTETGSEMLYDAFISYSPAKDKSIAAASWPFRASCSPPADSRQRLGGCQTPSGTAPFAS